MNIRRSRPSLSAALLSQLMRGERPLSPLLRHTEPSFLTPPGFIPVVKSLPLLLLFLLLLFPTDVRGETGFEYLIRGFTGSLTIISSAGDCPCPCLCLCLCPAHAPGSPPSRLSAAAVHTTPYPVGFSAFLLTTEEKSRPPRGPRLVVPLSLDRPRMDIRCCLAIIRKKSGVN